jgi:hypothetical protein
MDDIRNTAGLVVAGFGEFVHAGRFYPHFASARTGRSCDQPVKRAK